MEIFATDKLRLFFVFFVPGFISMKVYNLMVAGDRHDFSKDLLEAVAYGAINFAAFSWVIFLINSLEFYSNHKFWYYALTFMIMFVAPIIWPFAFLRLFSFRFIAKHVMHPVLKPWDYVFGKKESFWTIVHLKSGQRIGGIYDTRSFASSYPSKEQIYLEQVWRLDDKGAFIEPVERSKGIIITGEEIVAVEFFVP
ncbi:MAG: hypothetical protein A4E61_01604 [Syntrophorhabdus sp. PtaB.Bin184]|nr:MAG: hypothetical protein A4E61_01604 [Syntrophorhabdus sp. PtaB.Bin184]